MKIFGKLRFPGSKPTDDKDAARLADVFDITDQLANGYSLAPDYANMETTNRITANNGSWTVDRDGYVYIGANASGSQSYRQITIKINGKVVGLDYQQSNVNAAPSASGAVLAVKTGDVCSVTNSNDGVFCYFIPPVLNPPLYVRGQPLINYSTAEQDTGRTWIDGRKIYHKTVNLGQLTNSGTDKIVAHGITNFGTCIEMFGIATDGTATYAIPCQTVYLYSNVTNVVFITNGSWSAYTGIVTISYTCTDR